MMENLEADGGKLESSGIREVGVRGILLNNGKYGEVNGCLKKLLLFLKRGDI